MQIYRTIEDYQLGVGIYNHGGHEIALVPTMGALHEGHLSLIKIAAQKDCPVAVSIFVNPSQFNDSKDLEKYPRNLDADLEKIAGLGVNYVFAPEAQEIYGTNFQNWIEPGALTKRWEGEFRPGHFRGVATVVSILFNIINPTYAIFGEKDFQQLRVIEKMVQDLKTPTEIIRAPIIRENDGLALSSRNVLLSVEGRTRAGRISAALRLAREIKDQGETDASKIINKTRSFLLEDKDISLDYLALVDEETLEPVEEILGNPARMIVTARIEGIRLLDNMRI